MLYNIKFKGKLLQIQKTAVLLHQVFHGIRFKVNKGWVKALTLFLYHKVPYQQQKAFKKVSKYTSFVA